MSVLNLSCPRCHSEKINTQQIALPNGHHIKATCAACGRFIKFLAQDTPRFHFGKYKGLTVSEIAAKDLSYLKWALSKDIIRNTRLRDAIEYEVLTA